MIYLKEINKMINEKYTKKMMEIKKVGEYVERLASIENDMCQDVDEGNIDKYILTLVENCIDVINQEYILASARQDINEIKALKDKLAKCWCYGQKLNEYDKVTNDCDEFGKVSDVLNKDEEFIKANYDVDNLLKGVTQDDESNDNGGI